MSIARMYEIACDKCGEPYDGGMTYLVPLRTLARKSGWITGPREDVCPTCRHEC